ncbi:phosphoribosylaminoimidazolesuccinocarboxamide synthase [Desulfatibacillum aliphaticivorans]|uniref:phosphoribosylaminoimidazolesuccinocarboxamide synthase n=1 Tax=Desulfatibacillum aliphaticivorans TaxID=218208 RepID=UPI0003FB98B9|nr:phosphoribosylaminoimidazolesuccinocarboxamide synthase [Desulfatibacillum aliphaticivorans]
MASSVWQTELPDLPEPKRGKVRDMYDLGDAYLMVATDRLSAFDVIMPDPIPDKGKVLTQISLFWFDVMKDIVDNHVLTAKVDEFPVKCRQYADILEGRSILVKKVQPQAIECVVRGYISGSGWSSYKKSQSVCGISLPEGLKESEKLPETLFTPSTKAELGEHDENISFEQSAEIVGQETAEKLRDLSLAIYTKGADLANEKGIIIADTKFEFGAADDGQIILIDEVLTPDSSRFWPKDQYEPGRAQDSFDKQFVRDYLLEIKFNKQPPGPKLPQEVLDKTRDKYLQALKLLAGDAYSI